MNASPGDLSQRHVGRHVRPLLVAKPVSPPTFPTRSDEDVPTAHRPNRGVMFTFVAVAAIGLLSILVSGGILLWADRDRDDRLAEVSDPETAKPAPIVRGAPPTRPEGEPRPIPTRTPAPEPPKTNVATSPPKPAPGTSDDEPLDVRPKVFTGEEVYQKLLKSTVFIYIETPTSRSCGSGALIHAARKLVLTNYHVVGDHPRVLTFFPSFGKDGVEPKPRHYIDNARTLGIPAKVLVKSPKQDLALLELERLPENVAALPLSTKPAGAGAKLYSVGASGMELRDFSGTLWRLSAGEARGRNNMRYQFADGQLIDAMFLESQKPINSGDSGGPTVNESGALVAVVSNKENSRITNRDNVYRDVDLTEVQSFLASYAGSTNASWDGPTQDSGGLTAGPKVLARLAARLKDSDAGVRLKAVRQIGTLGAEARPLCVDLIPVLEDSDEQVRLATEDALNAIGFQGKAESSLVENALAGTEPNAKRYALAAFARENGPALTATLVPTVVLYLDDSSATARTQALTALTRYGSGCKAKALPKALDCLGDEDAAVSRAAAKLLAACCPMDAVDIPALEAGLDHKGPVVRRFVAMQLVPMASDSAQVLKWSRPFVKTGSDVSEAVPAIAALLKDEDPAVANFAISALAKLGPAAQPAIPALLDVLRKPNYPLSAVRTVPPKGWKPAITPEMLAKIGGDGLVKSLLPLTEFTNVSLDGVKKKRLTNAVDVAQQCWAISLLASIETSTLTEDGKQQLIKKLAFLSKFDPDIACRQLAKAGLDRHAR